jgi:putative transposase
LERLVERHGAPEAITIDNGTEFDSKVMDEWAFKRRPDHQRKLTQSC